MTKDKAANWIKNRCKEFKVPNVQISFRLDEVLRDSGFDDRGRFISNGKILGQHFRIYNHDKEDTEESRIIIYQGANKETLRHEFVHYLRAEKRVAWPKWVRKIYRRLGQQRWEEYQTYKMAKWPLYSLRHWFVNSWGL